MKGALGWQRSFFGPLGVGIYKMMTDEDDKQFLYDPDKQTTYPVYKAKAEVFEGDLETQIPPWGLLGQNSLG